MMNKKLIALFVTVATVAAVSAHYRDGECYVDRYGNERCGSRVIEGTVDTAGRAVEGAEDVTFGAVGGLFGRRGPVERVEDRREQRRMSRDARRTRQ